jgi:HD-GYP domain-containing protein (c-di-GMP phosphodiesterase class II)
VEQGTGEAEGGVRTVLLEAVRVTDEALRGLGRAERSADPGSRLEIQRVRGEVRQSARLILESLLGSVEVETGRQGHSRRVAAKAGAIAAAMGLPADQIQRIEDAGRLHDVGELLLDWEQMSVRRELLVSERRSLRRHPTIGQRLLPTVGLDEEACRIVGAHHERLDGSGYPDRIADSIPIGAQILAVAEAYEAITHERPYRTRTSVDEAMQRLRDEAQAGRFNAAAVAALEEIVKERG